MRLEPFFLNYRIGALYVCVQISTNMPGSGIGSLIREIKVFFFNLKRAKNSFTK